MTRTSSDCRGIEAVIAYVCGDGGREERRRVSAHLEECDACATDLRAVTAIREALLESPVPEARLDFAAVVAGAARRRTLGDRLRARVAALARMLERALEVVVWWAVGEENPATTLTEERQVDGERADSRKERPEPRDGEGTRPG